jgi:hypothetical protein
VAEIPAIGVKRGGRILADFTKSGRKVAEENFLKKFLIL